jgi:hypothetical protein
MQQAPGRAPGPFSTLPHGGGGSGFGSLCDSVVGWGGKSRAPGHAAANNDSEASSQHRAMAL